MVLLTKQTFHSTKSLKSQNSTMPHAQNVVWNNTLSGNKDNTHHAFAVFPMGACLLQTGSTDNLGFVNNVHVLVYAKAIEIFEFIDNFEVTGCLIDNNKLKVTVSAKDIRTSPHSIMKRFLG